MDLQRATQAYLDFYQALSVYGKVKGQIRDFCFKNSSDIGVAPGPGLFPSELYLTGNNSTVNVDAPIISTTFHRLLLTILDYTL
jgi:hypothetical protein